MRFLRGGIAGAFINGVFWFLCSMTGNIVLSMGITAVVCIGVFAALRRMNERKLK